VRPKPNFTSSQEKWPSSLQTKLPQVVTTGVRTTLLRNRSTSILPLCAALSPCEIGPGRNYLLRPYIFLRSNTTGSDYCLHPGAPTRQRFCLFSKRCTC